MVGESGESGVWVGERNSDFDGRRFVAFGKFDIDSDGGRRRPLGDEQSNAPGNASTKLHADGFSGICVNAIVGHNIDNSDGDAGRWCCGIERCEWLEHQRSLRPAKRRCGELGCSVGDFGRGSGVDADTDRKFGGCGGASYAWIDGEDCAEERFGGDGQRESAVDGFVIAADAVAFAGLEHSQLDAGQNGDRRD